MDRLCAALNTSPYTDYHRMKGISFAEWMTTTYETDPRGNLSAAIAHVRGMGKRMPGHGLAGLLCYFELARRL